MLQYQALFFCTCAKMQEMDPFEGRYPRKNIEKLELETDFRRLPPKYVAKANDYRDSFLQNVSINCWHATILKMPQCGECIYHHKKELQ